MKRILIFTLIFTLSFGLQVLAANFPVTVKDDLGTSITINEKPERIISLAPSNTEILYALGLEDKIVGVTTYADYPAVAAEKDKIGSIIEPSIEKIVALEPDIVVASDINKMQTYKRLKELGLNVVGFKAKNVDEAIQIIKRMGKVTGKGEKAQEIVTDMYIQLAEISNMVEKYVQGKSKPKVFYELWHDPLYTAGKNTFVDDLINLAGGINIGADARGEWPQYSLEKLLTENPGVYIAILHSTPEGVTAKEIKNRDRYGTLKAVRNDRVYIVDQNIVSRPSPRLIEGLKAFVKAIHPELAAEVDKIE